MALPQHNNGYHATQLFEYWIIQSSIQMTFKNKTIYKPDNFDHFNTRLVQYSDGYCTYFLIFKMTVQNRYGIFGFKKCCWAKFIKFSMVINFTYSFGIWQWHCKFVFFVNSFQKFLANILLKGSENLFKSPVFRQFDYPINHLVIQCLTSKIQFSDLHSSIQILEN